MSISEEDRALIEAHIRAKGVTRCPTFALTPLEEIRYRDGRRNKKVDPRIAERNRLIERLHKEGLTQRAIAEALNVNQATISHRVRWIVYRDSLGKKSG